MKKILLTFGVALVLTACGAETDDERKAEAVAALKSGDESEKREAVEILREIEESEAAARKEAREKKAEESPYAGKSLAERLEIFDAAGFPEEGPYSKPIRSSDPIREAGAFMDEVSRRKEEQGK